MPSNFCLFLSFIVSFQFSSTFCFSYLSYIILFHFKKNPLKFNPHLLFNLSSFVISFSFFLLIPFFFFIYHSLSLSPFSFLFIIRFKFFSSYAFQTMLIPVFIVRYLISYLLFIFLWLLICVQFLLFFINLVSLHFPSKFCLFLLFVISFQSLCFSLLFIFRYLLIFASFHLFIIRCVFPFLLIFFQSISSFIYHYLSLSIFFSFSSNHLFLLLVCFNFPSVYFLFY